MTGERILVVEDEGLVAEDIQQQLTKLGFEVVGTAAAEQEAVDKAKATAPHMVLMDIHLADKGDGTRAAQQIKEALDIPVVYLTAYSDEKTLRRATLTEPFGYLVKPFQPRELRTTIVVALERHRQKRALDERNKELIALNDMFRKHLEERFIIVDAFKRMEGRLEGLATEASTLVKQVHAVTESVSPA
jgi:AmiR/NasT family two-component response regulator